MIPSMLFTSQQVQDMAAGQLFGKVIARVARPTGPEQITRKSMNPTPAPAAATT